MQEVYLRLLRVDDQDAIRNPQAYLFTVASHVLHQHALRQSSSLDSEALDRSAPPEEAVQKKPGLTLADAALLQFRHRTNISVRTPVISR